MGTRPRLLDLYCGAGGCARGYVLAGFEVHGVYHRPQPRYPLSGAATFTRADALEYLREHGREYHAIHASPPCQAYSSTRFLKNVKRERHVDLLAPTREALLGTARPWVIENVDGAPMEPPAVQLCGLMFGLRVFRHRWFETFGFLCLGMRHPAHGDRRVGKNGFVCVAGNGGGHSSGWLQNRRYVPRDHRNKSAWSKAMGIDWMTRDELAQAIPPAYTRFVGRQLLAQVESNT